MHTGLKKRTLNLCSLITHLHHIFGFGVLSACAHASGVCEFCLCPLSGYPPPLPNSPFGPKEQLPWWPYPSGLVGGDLSQSLSAIPSNLSPSPFFLFLQEKKIANPSQPLKEFLKKNIWNSHFCAAVEACNMWRIERWVTCLCLCSSYWVWFSVIHKQKWYS